MSPRSIGFDHIGPTTRKFNVANVIVEIPKGSRNQFAADPETGLIRFERCLSPSSRCPGDYGFVPQTLAEDGDSLDALVMVDEPTFSGCLICARVIGMLRIRVGGKLDSMLLAVPDRDPLYVDYNELADAPSDFLRTVLDFFTNRKQLEGTTVEAEGWTSAIEAHVELQASITRYRETDSEITAVGTDNRDYE